MPLSYKIILSAALLLTAVAFGRYSVSGADKSETKQTQTQVDTVKQEDKQIQTHTVTVTTKEPTGAIETTTTTDTGEHITATTTADTRSSSSTVITSASGLRRAINLSALASYDTNGRAVYYGASFSREVLGPVTLGVFGLTNKTYGVSIGLDF